MRTIPPHLVLRFQQDVERLTIIRPAALALAVSGGPDSLALLLLARAAYPGRIRAATVDHGLRPESAAEAEHVAAVCRDLRVPHTILAPAWDEPASSNIQARARAARYAALFDWNWGLGGWLVTAHHLDDQAETVLMRLARGAGLSGLAAVRPMKFLTEGMGGDVIRPMLGWRKAELEALVEAAGLTTVDDPSNASDAFDRTAARRLLAETDWLDPARLAATASALADCEDALEWVAGEVFQQRGKVLEAEVSIDPHGLPREVQRRVLLQALWHFTDEKAIPGPKLIRLLDALLAGEPGTLAGVQARPDPHGAWHFSFAPPRRSPDR